MRKYCLCYYPCLMCLLQAEAAVDDERGEVSEGAGRHAEAGQDARGVCGAGRPHLSPRHQQNTGNTLRRTCPPWTPQNIFFIPSEFISFTLFVKFIYNGTY